LAGEPPAAFIVNGLLALDASTLAARIAAGAVSSHETVVACLDRLASLDRVLGAFVDVRAERAGRGARLRRRRGPRREPRCSARPGHVKSAIEVAGLRVETGSPSRRGIVAGTDAVGVARLREAGAIVLGSTNVADMLMGYESDNPLHGRTNSPWDLERTPGGSSGGESAAIAAGCSAGGIGSDGGSSIRVPAHFTGICGLKPTPGRVPATGHQPACLAVLAHRRGGADGALGGGSAAPASRARRLGRRRSCAVPAGAGRAQTAPEVWWFDTDARAPATPPDASCRVRRRGRSRRAGVCPAADVRRRSMKPPRSGTCSSATPARCCSRRPSARWRPRCRFSPPCTANEDRGPRSRRSA
jgi:hypothetical protein